MTKNAFAAAAATAAALALGASAAQAASITVAVPSGVDAGAPIPVTYNASGVPRGATVVLQRQVGTSKAWRNQQTVKAGSGTVQFAGLPMGQYAIRGAIVQRGHRTLASRVARFATYGDVPLATLLNNTEDVVTVPTATFRYAAQAFRVYQNTDAVVFTIKTNNCRSVHLDVLFVGYHNEGSGTATLVQETADPVTVSAPSGVVAGLDASLTPGRSWSLNMRNDTPQTESGYADGTASCFSRASGRY